MVTEEGDSQCGLQECREGGAGVAWDVGTLCLLQYLCECHVGHSEWDRYYQLVISSTSVNTTQGGQTHRSDPMYTWIR